MPRRLLTKRDDDSEPYTLLARFGGDIALPLPGPLAVDRGKLVTTDKDRERASVITWLRGGESEKPLAVWELPSRPFRVDTDLNDIRASALRYLDEHPEADGKTLRVVATLADGRLMSLEFAPIEDSI